jgi:hypothetical protein
VKPQEAAQNNKATIPQKSHTPVGQNATRKLSGKNISISYQHRAFSHADDGGVDRRQTASHETTREVHGLPPIVFEFFDFGVSGTTTQRDGYQQMNTVGVENRGATIMVDQIDRVLRNCKVAMDFSSFTLENELVLYDSKGLVTHEELLHAIAGARIAHKFIVGRMALKSDDFFEGGRS